MRPGISWTKTTAENGTPIEFRTEPTRGGANLFVKGIDKPEFIPRQTAISGLPKSSEQVAIAYYASHCTEKINRVLASPAQS